MWLQCCFRYQSTLSAGVYLALFKAVTTAQNQQVQCVLVYSVPHHVLPKVPLSTAEHKQHLNPGDWRGSRKKEEKLFTARCSCALWLWKLINQFSCEKKCAWCTYIHVYIYAHIINIYSNSLSLSESLYRNTNRCWCHKFIEELHCIF